MALALLGVKYKGDKRDQYLHHGGWLLKLGLWLAFSALPFLFPNSLVNAYGAHIYSAGDPTAHMQHREFHTLPISQKALVWLSCCFSFVSATYGSYARQRHLVCAGWLARVGSGLFLILQMVILLDFVQTWNDAWVSMEDENYIYGLLGLTVTCCTVLLHEGSLNCLLP